MPTLKESLRAQFEAVGDDYKASTSLEHLPGREEAIHAFEFGVLSVVERATGKGSTRSQQARDLVALAVNMNVDDFAAVHARQALMGLAFSVWRDVENGFLDEARTLIHGEVFTDLLDQADYLLSEGYKDAAAVTCGSVLESHLRNLCAINSIDTADSDGKPKKASRLNDDLAKAKVNSSLEHKSVTAWQGLRNSAAHGDYGEYDAAQVKGMIQGVRDFMVRHQA